MTRVFIYGLAAFATVFAFIAAFYFLGHHIGLNSTGLVDLYDQKLRTSFFSGFLSLGGFLFSLKTFIVVKMKEGLYDSIAYQERYEKMRPLLGQQQNVTLYGPLQDFSHLLFYSILASFVTAVVQVTLGLWPAWWSVAICLSFSGATLVLLALCLLKIKGNLDEWFDALEKEAEKKRAELVSEEKNAAEEKRPNSETNDEKSVEPVQQSSDAISR